MKSLTIALMAAVLALPVALPVAAVARDHDRRGQEQGPPPGAFRPPANPGGNHPFPGGGYRGGYPAARPYAAPPPYGAARGREPGDWNDFGPPGAGQAMRWRRGQFLPPSFRGEVIGDYGRYHLRRPPPGYYWYRSGDDFVLAAVATGVIFEVVAGDEGY